MGKRGSSKGSVKQSRRDRRTQRASPSFERRADRDHGGPPPSTANIRIAEDAAAARERIRARYASAMAERARIESARRSATTEARRLAPVSTIVVATDTATAAPTRIGRRAQPTAGNSRARSVLSKSFAVALASLAATGFAAATLLPSARPAPPITAPISIVDAPLRSPHAIAHRIIEMTPTVRLAISLPSMTDRVDPLTLVPPPQKSAPPPAGTPREAVAPMPRPSISLPSTPPVVDAPARIAARVEPSAPSPVIVPLALPPLPLAGELTTPVRKPTALLPDIAPAAPHNPVHVEHALADTAPAQCRPQAASVTAVDVPSREIFGAALAAAALKQTEQFVVYDARYTRIAYPGGDVASLHGVCTDVVIRAYRALGVDLQRLVIESRLGTGDTSIDHRRTEVLRKFLATRGQSLPVSDDAADFQPGDIVTYYRPQNRLSTSHIAIVSDVIAPSGRPMIIHNRGLGVQLEDALFVDRITGHYRYTGPEAPLPPLTVAARPAPPKRPAPTATPTSLAAYGTARSTVSVRAAARSPAADKLWQRYANTPRASQ